MGDLLHVFVERFTAAGYALEDVAENESLFQLVAEEVCGLTPQQTGELRKEWELYTGRRGEMGGVFPRSTLPVTEPLRNIVDSSPSLQGLFAPYSTTTLLSRASRFLRHLSEGDIHSMSPATVTEVPVPQRLRQAFRERLSALHTRTGSVELMWKLCSPQTLAQVKEGRRMRHADARDMLCPSGIVLYRDNGSARHFLDDVPEDLVHNGWCLVAFDTAPGFSRRLEENEIRSLQHFTMEECFNSLNGDGYDSVRVFSCNAFVMFHPDQLVPRFIIGIQCPDTHRLNGSRVTNGAVLTPKVESPPGGPCWKKGEAHHEVFDSPSVVVATTAGGRLGNLDGSEKWGAVYRHSPPTSCQRHPEKEVEFWCPAEKRLLCSYCLFYDGYTKENCVLVVEAAGHEARRLERWVQNAATFVDEVGAVEELFRSAEEDLDRCEAERKDELRDKFNSAHAKLHALEADLLTQVEKVSGQQRQSLRGCLSGIQRTVGEVKRLIGDAEGPLTKYRAGTIDYNTAVAFLRVAQIAFGDWDSVAIPMYSVVRGWSRDVFKSLEAALEPATLPELGQGGVDLPEAVDVNHLRN